MSALWAKNMAGLQLEDENMMIISYPKLELTTHITTKFVELFAVTGTLLLGPLVGVARKQTRNIPGIISKTTKIGKRGVVLGLMVGPLMTWMKMHKIEGEEAYYDRCYRIRNNRNQVRVDRSAYTGTLGGAIIFPLIFKMCPIFGGLFGLTVGTVGAGIYNNV